MIFVAGATGNIGSELVRVLAERGEPCVRSSARGARTRCRPAPSPSPATSPTRRASPRRSTASTARSC